MAIPSTSMATPLPNFHALILAGGSGSRLDGYSTPEIPKQFLPITSPAFTMVQMTYRRLMAPLVEGSSAAFDPSRVHVMTNERYVPLVNRQLTAIPVENIFGEPIGLNRNTGPAVSVGFQRIANLDPDAIIAVLPSDHYVGDARLYVKQLNEAAELARTSGALVLFGIEPQWPSPHFGYIRLGADLNSPVEARNVRSFVEKPSMESAREFLKGNDYVWNSGMMVASARVYLDLLEEYQPDMFDGMQMYFQGRTGKEQFYRSIRSMCVNNAVLVHAAAYGRVAAMKFLAEWSDVGTWESIGELVARGSIMPQTALLRLLDEKLEAGHLRMG